MAKPLPRRLADMTLPESDSDDPDFKTPIKRVSKVLPKKASELAVVNSESEEEEDDGKDNLNCAINLNDSFICTPSKIIFTPMKSVDDKPDAVPLVHLDMKQDPQQPVPPTTKSSIFSVAPKSAQENDKNLVNLHVKKDFAAELERLALNDKAPVMIKSQSTSALGSHNSTQQQQQQGLKKKASNDDHAGIIRYRPINQKRVQQELQQKKEKPPPSSLLSWRRSNEFNSGDSGISSSTKQFQPSAATVASEKDIPDSAVVLPVMTNHEPVFATPGFQKAPLQVLGSKRLTNPRLPIASATKSQSTMKEEFQQRKVLFTTPMGGSCKPVSSLGNPLALDDSILADRLPELKEGSEEKQTQQQQQQQHQKEEQAKVQDRLQVRRIKNRDYAVEKKIGHGGSSTVFLGRRLDTDQEVALKVVDLQGDDAIIRGYLKETELLASLQGNPNIITLFDYYHSDKESKLYMVMEKGETDLHKILQTYKTDIPLYRLMRYWYEMLLAVDFIHQQGVIHLDLKPANFLMVGGRLKLIDFGIAAKINSDATSIVKDSQAGTFNYISPEALTDTSDESSTQNPKFKISTKSDVWSLGCILYSLVYKRTPFAHIKQIMMKVATITDPRTEIQYPELPIYYPSFLIKMLKTCLKHNPKERASVQDLLKFPFDMIIPVD